jgi:hypothetical protein
MLNITFSLLPEKSKIMFQAWPCFCYSYSCVREMSIIQCMDKEEDEPPKRDHYRSRQLIPPCCSSSNCCSTASSLQMWIVLLYASCYCERVRVRHYYQRKQLMRASWQPLPSINHHVISLHYWPQTCIWREQQRDVPPHTGIALCDCFSTSTRTKFFKHGCIQQWWRSRATFWILKPMPS